MKPAARPLLLFLLALALGWTAAPAQESPPPISQSEFITLVNAKTEPAELVELIRTRGISFKLTPELEAGLKGAKVKQEVIDILRAPATLEIHSNAPNGEVTIDAEPRGTLSAEGSLVVADLASGSHLIRLRADGFVPAQADVFLKPTETKRIEITLDPAVTTAAGPLGIRVNIQAGTVEDSAFAELEFEKEPAARARKLNALIQRFGEEHPLSLLALASLQETYLAAEEYEQALAAGEKFMQRDPNNFAARLRQARAWLGRGMIELAFDNGVAARRLLEALDAAPAPEGMSAEDWSSQKQRMGEVPQAQLANLSYDLLVKSAAVDEPSRKIRLMQRFLEVFPNSTYRGSVYVHLALAAQQEGDQLNMIQWLNQGLEINPDEPILLVMGATTLAERGASGSGTPTRQDLTRARQLTSHLLELLKDQPEKIRPSGLDDQQWASTRELWEGVGHFALAQVFLHEGSTDPPNTAKLNVAISEYKAAAPLLKSDAFSYGRNQFYLGFAYAKLGDIASARAVLNEVAELESPYAQAARNLLAQLPARRR